MNNDGTNACAFLSADAILSEVTAGSKCFTDLPEAIEDTIWHLPETINVDRNLHRLYDPIEVYVHVMTVTLAPGKGEDLLMIGKKNSPEVWLSLYI